MTPTDIIRAEDLPAEVRGGDASRPSALDPAMSAAGAGAIVAERAAAGETKPGPGTLREFKDAAERACLVQKLRENNWNISKTAEVIDPPRSNLYKKLEPYGIKQETDG